jgi:hypothetical protein
LPFTGWNFIESVDTQITGNVFPVDLKEEIIQRLLVLWIAKTNSKK